MLTDIVRRTIRKYQMLESGAGVLIGVSGGADSVALMLALKELRYEVEAVHVEHGIRGKDSELDMEYVRKLCGDVGIPLVTERIDAPAMAAEMGLSLEETARRMRYRIFDRYAEGRPIAVAHNLGDMAETMIWNLARGSGIAGMGSIPPVRGRIIRPLLETPRSEIESYLTARGIEWRQDETNADESITRNRIRHTVMPALKVLNPKAEQHIAMACMDLRESERFLAQLTDDALAQMFRVSGEEAVLYLENWDAQDEYMKRRILRSVIAALPGIRISGEDAALKDISRVHVEELAALCTNACGKMVYLPRDLRAVRQEDSVRFYREGAEIEWDGPLFNAAWKDKEEEPVIINHDGIYEVGGLRFECTFTVWEGGAVPQKMFTKWLRYDTITGYLCLRSRRSGDRLVIGSAGQTKKLKSELIDRKIPKAIRNRIPLVALDDHILWIVGQRISRDARVQPGDKCVRISLLEN